MIELLNLYERINRYGLLEPLDEDEDFFDDELDDEDDTFDDDDE